MAQMTLHKGRSCFIVFASWVPSIGIEWKWGFLAGVRIAGFEAWLQSEVTLPSTLEDPGPRNLSRLGSLMGDELWRLAWGDCCLLYHLGLS